MSEKRALVVIHAQGVADFRAQLDAAIAAAQRLADAPILPAEGCVSEAALVNALADIVERVCAEPAVVQSEQAKAA